MRDYASAELPATLSDIENWTALGSGALLLGFGATRRSIPGVCIALASAPLLYRGFTGAWPAVFAQYLPGDDTRTALGHDRGVHVREAVRIERPIAEVYRFWRDLENLARFMTNLERVTETSAGRSHWVALGPGGVRVEWEAEIINEVENQVLGWKSVPGSEVVTAGSVNFDSVRGGRSTQVTVHLQYAPPLGRAGAVLAMLFGKAPSQTIREDLRRFKQLMETGECAQAGSSPAVRP